MLDKNVWKGILKRCLIWTCMAILVFAIFDCLPFNYKYALGFLPVFGILGGPYGALGYSLAIIITAIISMNFYYVNFNIAIMFAILSFFLSYFFYKLWFSVGNKDKPIHLDSIGSIIKYILILSFISMLFVIIFPMFGVYNMYEVTHHFDYEFFLFPFLCFFNIGLIGIPLILIARYFNFSLYYPGKVNISLLNRFYNYLDKFKLGNLLNRNLQIFDYCLWIFIGIIFVLFLLFLFGGYYSKSYPLILSVVILLFFIMLIFKPLKDLKLDNNDLIKNNFISIKEIFVIFFVLFVYISVIILSIFYVNGAIYSIGELSVTSSFLIYIDFIIAILMIPSAIILNYIQKTVTNPINKLSNLLDNYVEDEFIRNDFEDYLKNNPHFLKKETEVSSLTKSFFNMTQDLKTYLNNIHNLTVANERVQNELRIAHNIQDSFLPTDFDINPNINVKGYMKPAELVGGDFYDFFMIDESHFAFVIGDVSDKGIPAALFMSKSIQLINSYLSSYTDLNSEDNTVKLKDLVYYINNSLCKNNESSMFVTCWIGIIDLNTGKLSYVNAGHEYPVVRLNNQHSLLKSENNLVLGVLEDEEFEVEEIYLNKGDRILLFTDGVTDANDDKGNFYGKDNLLNLLNDNNQSVNDTISLIINSVDNFSKNQKQFDDFTLLLVEYNKN